MSKITLRLDREVIDALAGLDVGSWETDVPEWKKAWETLIIACRQSKAARVQHFTTGEIIMSGASSLPPREWLTPEQVTTLVGALFEMRDNPERAHVNEDELRASVLETIAYGNPFYVELAQAVLKTRDVPFSRWCA